VERDCSKSFKSSIYLHIGVWKKQMGFDPGIVRCFCTPGATAYGLPWVVSSIPQTGLVIGLLEARRPAINCFAACLAATEAFRRSEVEVWIYRLRMGLLLFSSRRPPYPNYYGSLSSPFDPASPG